MLVDGYKIEDGKLYRVRHDTDRAAILDQNAKLRAEPEALRSADWGRWALRIPQDDYDELVKLYPQLQSSDSRVKHEAWKHFMALDVSIPYRVYPKTGRGRTA